MKVPLDVFIGWQPLVRAEVVAALLVASVPAFLLKMAVVVYFLGCQPLVLEMVRSGSGY